MPRVSDRSLVLTPMMGMDDAGVAIIVRDALFALGLEQSPWPDHPRSYTDKLWTLRDRLFVEYPDQGADALYYSHNDPRYIGSLTRRSHRLGAAVKNNGRSPAAIRLRDLEKQERELERHAQNGGFKRGVSYPVAV